MQNNNTDIVNYIINLKYEEDDFILSNLAENTNDLAVNYIIDNYFSKNKKKIDYKYYSIILSLVLNPNDIAVDFIINNLKLKKLSYVDLIYDLYNNSNNRMRDYIKKEESIRSKKKRIEEQEIEEQRIKERKIKERKIKKQKKR